MKIIKRVIILLLLFFLLLLSSSCRLKQVSESSDSRGTVTYVDCVGRNVELPPIISRIAAIDSFSAEAMVMIGAGDKMMACPNGTKSDVLLEQIYPNLNKVAVVQSNGSVNAEALLAIHPEVVLLKYGLYISDGEKEKLEKLGIPYLVISYTTMEEQIDAIRLIGQVAGPKAEKRANQIGDYYKNCIKRVKKIAKTIPTEKRVSVYHSINQTTCTDGKNSIGADWISVVGCSNCSVGHTLLAEKDIYFVTEEQVFVWNPDVVICNDVSTSKYILSNKGWLGLEAVRSKKVYNIPVGATRWGQPGSLETFFGMLWLGKTVYPDYYSSVNLKEEVLSFYKSILGIRLQDEVYEQMLSGEGLRISSQKAGN